MPNRPPGALVGEVLTTVASIGATSATRATALTPTTGTRVRVISVLIVSNGLTTAPGAVSVYFGTGAAYTTNVASAIFEGVPGTTGSAQMVWPDMGGPLGGLDEVVSWITATETETALRLTLTYRQEPNG